MTATHINVVKGPSKFDIMTSLFVRNPALHKVEFKAKDGAFYKATIDSCEAEDASGESWNVRGSLTNNDGRLKIVKRFSGHFRTDDRTGYLMVAE